MNALTAPAAEDPSRRTAWRNRNTVITVALVLVGAAAAWYLLLELAPMVRPLLIAALLAYVLMPQHVRLRRRVGTPVSLTILAGTTAGVLVVFAFVTYASILELRDDLPVLQNRASALSTDVEEWVAVHAPWTRASDDQTQRDRLNEQAANTMRTVLTISTGVLLEACVVALYLLFLLLEGSRLPDRIRKAYSQERADEILSVAVEINSTVSSYLKAKVRASLILAVPVGLVLWILGVKFALLWLVLTFLCNFIPYIGSVIAYSLPVSFAFLWFGITWEPIVAAAVLLLIHVTTATLIEPTMLGNAVGVSPLVILLSLAFWGLLWGLPGMFLAVPLTVVTFLVMDHFEQTRPIARLFRGG